MKKKKSVKEAKAKILTPEMREYLSAIGKEGGSKGGQKRAASLSRKRRVQIARMGVEARIAKQQAGKAAREKTEINP